MTNDQLNERLARLKNGDKSALEDIYNELSTPIFTIALRITRNRPLAEEATQDVFVKLFRSPPEKTLSNPRAYIFKAARNAALDALKNNPSHENTDDHTEIPAPQSGDHSDVAEALASLPEEQRSIVTLHINAGLKFREIAEVTGTPLGTVLWRYNKAISKLRDILNGGTL